MINIPPFIHEIYPFYRFLGEIVDLLTKLQHATTY